MGLAAVFDVTQSLHGLAALLGIPTLPVAAELVSASQQRNPAWASKPRALAWAAQPPWISLALMFAMVFIDLSHNDGQFSPGVWIGWPNRLLVVAYCVWLATAARIADQLQA